MLIGLNGRKQAGKDTVFERASHILADVLPVERASFADLLYRSAAASLGVTVAQLQEWKNDPGMVVSVGSVETGRVHAYAPIRQYLQHYGTEAHRDVFGTDFWVDNVDLSHAGRAVFVTDVRFENEAKAVAAAGGYVVQVVGPPEVENTGDGHASEAPLPAELIDSVLLNDVRDDGFRALDHHVNDLILSVLNGWQAAS
jgi:deoxynucleotide monophosphate kinase-like protein